MKKMYLGFLTIICLLLSSGSNAQTNYVVSGATGFLSQLNGVYVNREPAMANQFTL